MAALRLHLDAALRLRQVGEIAVFRVDLEPALAGLPGGDGEAVELDLFAVRRAPRELVADEPARAGRGVIEHDPGAHRRAALLARLDGRDAASRLLLLHRRRRG